MYVSKLGHNSQEAYLTLKPAGAGPVLRVGRQMEEAAGFL